MTPPWWFLWLFVALKLTGHIDWPWLWVLTPLWAPFAVLFCLVPLKLIADYLRKRR